MCAHLILGSSGTAERRVRLERNLSVGSDEGLDVVLPDPSAQDVVADRHASLIHREGSWFLRDESGSAGTFVNDRRIAGDQRLYDADVIEFGLGGPEATFFVDHGREGKEAGTDSVPPETLQFLVPDDAADAVKEEGLPGGDEVPGGAMSGCAAASAARRRAWFWLVGVVLLSVAAVAVWWWIR